MLKTRDDYYDLDKVISVILGSSFDGRYDQFIRLLSEEHSELFKAFVAEELYRAEIEMKTFLALREVAQNFDTEARLGDVQSFTFGLRDEVRKRIGLFPPDHRRFLTVDEAFARTTKS